MARDHWKHGCVRDVTVLDSLGWDERVESLIGDDPNTVPGRVVRVDLDSAK